MTGSIDLMASAMAYQGNRKAPELQSNMDFETMQKTAQDFEAFYLGQMLQPMFANIEAAEPFNGGPGGKIWRQMQVDEFGKAIARSGGVGIADMVMRQMIEMQEGSVQQ